MTAHPRTAAVPVWIFLTAILCFLTTGCTTRSGYRPVTKQNWQGLDAGIYDEREKQVPGREGAFLEKYQGSNFWLGHVEMTDYGSYQGKDSQITLLESAVEKEAHEGGLFHRGITIIAFVHGWDNNAQEGNENLSHFRSLLHDVAADEQAHHRGVLGVYLSWRGKSMVKPLKPLTYWGRARTADAIGHGIMVEALARIRNIHWLVAAGAGRQGTSNFDIYKNSRLVLIGHSFGGRALYSAVAEGMETNFLQPYWAARSFPTAQGREQSQATMQRVTGFGDLVLLINPAIKSLPYRKIHYAMHTNQTVNYDPKQPVLMMVLSAKNDTPNRSYLPVGETFGNRFRDLITPPLEHTEGKQNITALGHYAPFQSHELKWENDQLFLHKSASYFKPDAVTGRPPKTLRRDLMSLHGIATDADPGLLPYMVVSVDPKIIDGHSGFWPGNENRRAYDFVKRFISAQNNAVGAARAEQAAPAAARIVPAKYSAPAPSRRKREVPPAAYDLPDAAQRQDR